VIDKGYHRLSIETISGASVNDRSPPTAADFRTTEWTAVDTQRSFASVDSDADPCPRSYRSKAADQMARLGGEKRVRWGAIPSQRPLDYPQQKAHDCNTRNEDVM